MCGKHLSRIYVCLVIVIAMSALVGCKEEPAPPVTVSAKEETQDRADFLKRDIQMEKLLVEKLKLDVPKQLTSDELAELEKEYDGSLRGSIVVDYDLEYGVARVNYDRWAELPTNRKIGIVSLLSEYRYAKVGAQFVSVRRQEGQGEVAKAGINGAEVFR